MLTGYFMRELEYATVEEALHIERLLKIGSTTFSLGNLDDKRSSIFLYLKQETWYSVQVVGSRNGVRFDGSSVK